MNFMNLLAFITWTVNPVAFSIGSMEIRWYGILLALGFVLAYITLQQIFKKEEVVSDTKCQREVKLDRNLKVSI